MGIATSVGVAVISGNGVSEGTGVSGGNGVSDGTTIGVNTPSIVGVGCGGLVGSDTNVGGTVTIIVDGRGIGSGRTGVHAIKGGAFALGDGRTGATVALACTITTPAGADVLVATALSVLRGLGVTDIALLIDCTFSFIINATRMMTRITTIPPNSQGVHCREGSVDLGELTFDRVDAVWAVAGLLG